MPRYQFPIRPDGLTFDVVIVPDQQTVAQCMATGQPYPKPVSVKALVDTGSDFTGVSAAVIARIGLPYLTTVQTQTASGIAVQRQFWAGVSFPPSAGHPHPVSWHPQLIVNELTAPPAGFDCLIGLNLLKDGVFILNGPAGWFVIDF